MKKRPSLLMWLPFAGILKIAAYLKGGRISNKVKIKKPAIVLCNHTSFQDYVFSTAAVYPKRINYFAAAKMFLEPKRGTFLKLGGAIPKSLFQSDPKAAMQGLKVLKNKGILGVYPEGQIAYHGVSLKAPFSIAKFIKKANVNVYVIKMKNNYLMAPPWSKYIFKGRVFTEMSLLLTPPQINEMSEQEIFDQVDQGIYFNTPEFNQQQKLKYKVRPINNLENLLYQCPNCLHEGLVANDNKLDCPQCGHQLVYDEYGLLNGDSVYHLFETQRKRLIEQIEQDEQFTLTDQVSLVRYKDNKLQETGSGILSLNRQHYVYKGNDNGQDVVYQFSCHTVPYIPSDVGVNIQIYDKYELFQFHFADKKLPTKYVLTGEYFYSLTKKETIYEKPVKKNLNISYN